jgi:hypothetical protein
MGWRVRFELASTGTRGEIVDRLSICEAGFENRWQAETWLATGAEERYGAAFWYRLRSVHVEDSYEVYSASRPAPPFTAGGATRDGDTVIEATQWYTRDDGPFVRGENNTRNKG